MTTLPEEAVKAASHAVILGEDEKGNPVHLSNEEARTALTAALPLLPVQGAVKKLEWTKGVVDIASPHPGMKYVACSTTPKGSWAFWLDHAPETRSVFTSEEAAKAAAQADYEARILSAIEPSPSPRAQALEEGFRKGLEAACEVIDAHSEYDRRLCCDGRECGCYGATVHQSMHHYIRALSSPDHADAGKLVEGDGWLPIESAPKDGTEILAWRKDCGWFIASFTSCSAFPLSQSEIDELDEETLFKEDWFTQWPQALRLEGSEEPTHWRPLPSAPSQEVAGS